jgi:uracil-DNA glycosylase
MNWDKFKDQFHESWHLKMQPFIESEACDNIYKYLKSESQRGKKIAPLSQNVYRCFLETPLDELKVVLMGFCPYHTLKNGSPVADGLLMGCSTTGVLQPSLEQFYNAIERENYDGLCTYCDKTKQGVLMFNASLTVEINKAGSHMEIWEPFTKYVIEEILNPAGVPFIFLGKDAAKYAKYVNPFSWSFTTSHPASASYKNTDWESGDVFKMVNKVLKDNNNYQIEWLDGTPF